MTLIDEEMLNEMEDAISAGSDDEVGKMPQIIATCRAAHRYKRALVYITTCTDGKERSLEIAHQALAEEEK